MINHYFQNKNPINEVLLIEDLITEAIEIQGLDVYYIPRNSLIESDLFYGDDPLKSFSKSYLVTVYLSEAMAVGGNDFFSKFGLTIPNNTKILISRRHFKRDVPELIRPIEGDLIFVPQLSKNGEIYEIRFIDDTKDMYSLQRGSPYYYEVALELFKYSQETINVGQEQVDDINFDAFNIDYNVYNGSGDYLMNENVSDGHANTAEVLSWDSIANVVTLINISGVFNANANIIGATSGVRYMVKEFNDLIMDEIHIDSNNYNIANAALTVIDSSIKNPIGTLGRQTL